MATYVYSTIPSNAITEDQLKQCSVLFDHNYGVWDAKAVNYNPHLHKGSPVKMSPHMLQEQLSLGSEGTLLSTCTLGGSLVGHAFATTWNYGDGIICWITQLVVSVDHRRKGIATEMLRLLRAQALATSMGLASSHPAACMALAKSCNARMPDIDLTFTKAHARRILETTPVAYLKTAKVLGSLFDDSDATGAVSELDTKFFVDRAEPIAAQVEFEVKYGVPWPLGKLLDGDEFLLLLQVTI